jgi:hypothetical protein
VEKHRRPGDVLKLQQWLETWPKGIHGEPVDRDGLGDKAFGEFPVASTRSLPSDSHPSAPKQSGGFSPSIRATVRPATRVPKGTVRGAMPHGSPRRLILSRKGFDSSYGGMASPILPDGRLVPLPIPSRHDDAQMQHSVRLAPEFADLVSDLSQGRYDLSSRIHLDPDLDRRTDLRSPGWRPSLGQTGSAQSHLDSQGVERGDVFLFFGWFREVERARGRWRYAPSAPNLHALFGWLEIGEVLSIVPDRQSCLDRHPWIASHPHVANPSHYSSALNTLYIAAERSAYRQNEVGGGYFERLEDKLRLTSRGQSRSNWELPAWFYPEARTPLSYHGRLDRWARRGDYCSLKSVAKGQEFVLNLDEYPESLDWLREIVGLPQGPDEKLR